MPKALPFVEFCEDVLCVRLTRVQRVLCRVAIDGAQPAELDGEDRQAARRLFGEVDQIAPSARGVFVAVCGARSGKSYILGALYSLWRALTADLSALAPGEQASALIVAPDLRLARQTLRYALGAAKACRAVAPFLSSETGEGFTLARPDGGRVAVEVLPATRGGSALRGRSLVSAVLDESAFFRSADYIVNDEELYRAVSPRVMPGGLVVLASTPWAEAGLLFELCSKNFGAPRGALVARCPTIIMRDSDPSIVLMVEREKERDPDNARREYGAEFMSVGTGLYFDPEVIGGAFVDGLKPALVRPLKGSAYLAADLGLVRDSSAFVAVHEQGPDLVVAEILELRPTKGNPLRLSEVCASLVDMAERHGVSIALSDHHLLDAAREHLAGSGLMLEPHSGGMAGKVESYHSARELLNTGSVLVPGEYRRLGEQLKRVTAKPTTGGGMTLSSPRTGGSHGDLASAFVLALWRARPRGLDMITAIQRWMENEQAAAGF